MKFAAIQSALWYLREQEYAPKTAERFGTMRSELKRKKALDGFKAMLLAEGAIQEDQADEIDSLLHTVDPSIKEKQLFQAEGMLLHLRYLPGSMITKKCLECKELFRSSYMSVAYCSDPCRAKAFERQMGVKWTYDTDHYHSLRAERPLVIGPECYQILLEFARDLLDQHNILIQEPLTEDASEQLLDQLTDDPQTSLEVSPPQSDAHEQLLEDLLDLFE